MYTGRHRRKSHGGLPQGSTINAGASLHFYYKWNNRETVDEWPDSSQNTNPFLYTIKFPVLVLVLCNIKTDFLSKGIDHGLDP